MLDIDGWSSPHVELDAHIDYDKYDLMIFRMYSEDMRFWSSP